ncbi:MAG: PDZ domain-containing protein [Gemmatales bacterium]|nr:PDZ domain-containing protein [Gemmatales bacterium]
MRKEARRQGTFRTEMLWVYPLPENIGLVLDIHEGNHVRRVLPNTPAHRAGLQSGDVLITIGNTPIRSQADCMHALHIAPQQGELSIRYRRGSRVHEAVISLQYGWKKSDSSWRPSLRKENRP